MKTYDCTAHSSLDNTQKKLSLSANSIEHAQYLLLKQGLKPVKIKLQKELELKLKLQSKSHTAQIRYQFFKQLAELTQAHLDIHQALENMIESKTHKIMSHICQKLTIQLQKGDSLSDAMQSLKPFFSEQQINLVNIGEQSGNLSTILYSISKQLEQNIQFKSKFKKAIFYPICILSVSIIVMSIMLIFVIPKFQNLFNGFNAKLPELTILIIQLSNFLAEHIHIILLSVSVILLSFIFLIKISKAFQYCIHWLILSIPPFSKISRLWIWTMLCQNLSLLISSDIQLTDSLKSLEPLIKLKPFQKAWKSVQKNIQSGQLLSESIQNSPYNYLKNPLIVQMIKTGESTGQLKKLLHNLSSLLLTQQSESLEKYLTQLEPLLLSIMGGIVGIMVLAMYLPIFQMGQVM